MMKRAKIKPGSIVWQDYRCHEWPEKNKDIVLLVVWESGTGAENPRVELCAPGYGQIGDYGAGSIFADFKDVVEERLTEEEKQQVLQGLAVERNDPKKQEAYLTKEWLEREVKASEQLENCNQNDYGSAFGNGCALVRHSLSCFWFDCAI